MHHLTVLLKGPLHLIGSGLGSGERVIAAWKDHHSKISRACLVTFLSRRLAGPRSPRAEPIRRSRTK